MNDRITTQYKLEGGKCHINFSARRTELIGKCGRLFRRRRSDGRFSVAKYPAPCRATAAPKEGSGWIGAARTPAAERSSAPGSSTDGFASSARTERSGGWCPSRRAGRPLHQQSFGPGVSRPAIYRSAVLPDCQFRSDLFEAALADFLRAAGAERGVGLAPDDRLGRATPLLDRIVIDTFPSFGNGGEAALFGGAFEAEPAAREFRSDRGAGDSGPAALLPAATLRRIRPVFVIDPALQVTTFGGGRLDLPYVPAEAFPVLESPMGQPSRALATLGESAAEPRTL